MNEFQAQVQAEETLENIYNEFQEAVEKELYPNALRLAEELEERGENVNTLMGSFAVPKQMLFFRQRQAEDKGL